MLPPTTSSTFNTTDHFFFCCGQEYILSLRLEASYFSSHFQEASCGLTLHLLGFRGQPILASRCLSSLGLQPLTLLLQAPLNEFFCLPAEIMA